MADISDIKMKMKEDGFEFLVEITCFRKYNNRVFERVKRKYYLFAKAIGNNMFYKIVNDSCSGSVIEQIEPMIIQTNFGEKCEVNAKFKEHLNLTYSYFKLPTLY